MRNQKFQVPVASRFHNGDDVVEVEVGLTKSLNQSPNSLSGPRTAERDFWCSLNGLVHFRAPSMNSNDQIVVLSIHFLRPVPNEDRPGDSRVMVPLPNLLVWLVELSDRRVIVPEPND